MISEKLVNYYKVIITIYYKNIRSLFSLFIIVASQVCLADLTPSDLRLFFLSKEQAPSKFIWEDSGTSRANSMSKRSPPKLSSVIEQPVVTRLWFNGFVHNRNRILLLVNDLPCDIVSDESVSQTENSKVVKCQHIKQKQYRFTLRTDKHALRVYKGSKYIATLFVGQSL
ncbi:MAG: hypothetical protein ACI9XK_003465 [Granulosicoccus sp.]|jgi:hypothetical protein